jgi:hypothetical protein
MNDGDELEVIPVQDEFGPYERVVICHDGKPVIITVSQNHNGWVANWAFGSQGFDCYFSGKSRQAAIDGLRKMLPPLPDWY